MLLVVLGAAESGIGAAVLAKKNGYEVFISDYGTIKPQYKKMIEDYGFEYEENNHNQEKILSSDIIIKSPGVPESAPIVKKIREKNIPCISEIEFASRYTNAKKICITGSNGKTTTTELTYKILKEAGLNVDMCGNIGNSFALSVATKEVDYYVLELSSFQLDDMYDFKAEFAILLNVTPDHLDRYQFKMQNYTDSKFRITNNQRRDDVFAYFTEDPIVSQEMPKRQFGQMLMPFSIDEKQSQGAYLENNKIVVKYFQSTSEFDLTNVKLMGPHNKANMMAAILAAKFAGVDNNDIQKTLENFMPLEHRIEKCGVVDGVTYINDSKATNVDAVYFALKSVGENVILILGGVDKGNDYSQLYPLVEQKVKLIVAMGKNNKPILDAFSSKVKIIETFSLEECIKTCKENAKSGDTVLLSPACASFDLFTCYEQRGDLFKEAVKNLK